MCRGLHRFRMGRGVARDLLIQVRVSTDEHNQIRALAQGKPISAYMRERALGGFGLVAPTKRGSDAEGGAAGLPPGEPSGRPAPRPERQDTLPRPTEGHRPAHALDRTEADGLLFSCPIKSCDYTAGSPNAVCRVHGRKVR